MAKRTPATPAPKRVPFQAWVDHVIVDLEPAESKTAGGVYLSDDSKAKDNRVGKIVSIGPGRASLETGKRIPIELQLGQRVILEAWAGKKMRIDGVEYCVIRESSVIAIVLESVPVLPNS